MGWGRKSPNGVQRLVWGRPQAELCYHIYAAENSFLAYITLFRALESLLELYMSK